MPSAADWNRRRILQSLLLLPGLLPLAADAQLQGQTFAHLVEDLLKKTIGDHHAAASIAQTYLEGETGSDEGLRLITRLVTRLYSGVPMIKVASRSESVLLGSITEMVEADFANAEVVKIGGWILSENEMTLYVLSSRYC